MTRHAKDGKRTKAAMAAWQVIRRAICVTRTAQYASVSPCPYLDVGVNEFRRYPTGKNST